MRERVFLWCECASSGSVHGVCRALLLAVSFFSRPTKLMNEAFYVFRIPRPRLSY